MRFAEKKAERDHEMKMKKLDITYDEGERVHEKEMKELRIRHDETKAAGKVFEHEAKMQVCEVFRCYLKVGFNILIKVMKLEFEERMRQNKRNG